MLAGFGLLFIGTLVVMADADFGLPIMQGAFYLYFQSLALDIAGLCAVTGLAMALCRRLLFRPARLANSWRDAIAAPALLVILLTGYSLHGLRIVATQDPWAAWAPISALTGAFYAAILPASFIRPLHASLWWFHLVLVLSLMAALPYLKLLHIFTAPLDIYFRPLDRKGAVLQPIDLETAQNFGVKSIDEFTWKSLLDLDACTECGRCQDACPAYASGKPLSPKSLILDLRGQLAADAAKRGPLIGGTIAEETLWSCTTCMACMEACPVFIEHVPKIVDMRRYLVMEEGRFPDSMQQALRSLESRGQPFQGNNASRLDWCKGLDVKILGPGESADYLYWVGCSTALNVRNQKVARAFVEILASAGVDFGILGNEEHCTGDPARRMGNEYLFQTLAQQNIATLQIAWRAQDRHHLPALHECAEERICRPSAPISKFSTIANCWHASRRKVASRPPVDRPARSPFMIRAISGATTASSTNPAQCSRPLPARRWSRCRGTGRRASAAVRAADACGWRSRARSASAICAPAKRSRPVRRF